MGEVTKPVRFQLSHANAKHSGTQTAGREYSIWVSDLTSDVTEKDLRKTFETRYNSVKVVKLVKESITRVYGFVCFEDPDDHRDALIHMTGFRGLGNKAIKVSVAVPKAGLSADSAKRDTEEQDSYKQYYEEYWKNSATWVNSGAYPGQHPGVSSQRPVLLGTKATQYDFSEEEKEGDEDILVDPNLPVNVDAMNTAYISGSREVWEKVDKDRWIYDLDKEEGYAPNCNDAVRKVQN